MSWQNNRWRSAKEWSHSEQGIKMQLEEEQDNQNNKMKHSWEPSGSPAISTHAHAEQWVSQQEQQQGDC